MSFHVIRNNTARVKKSNSELIKQTLKDMGSGTCTEVAMATRLSVATCRNILNELVSSGEVELGEINTNSGGRPAKTYRFNETHNLAMGICLDKNNNIIDFRYTIFNLYNDVIIDRTTKHESITIDMIDEVITAVMKDYPDIASIAFGIPGIASPTGLVRKCDIQELDGFDLAKHIEEKHNVKTVVAGSPGLIAYGYYKNHKEVQGKTFAALYAPANESPGVGIIIQDHIYTGEFGAAGEIAFAYSGTEETLDYKSTDNKSYINMTASAASLICAMINPANLLICGATITKKSYYFILSKCAPYYDIIGKPEFTYIERPEEEYISGVMSLAVDNLNDTIKLVNM